MMKKALQWSLAMVAVILVMTTIHSCQKQTETSSAKEMMSASEQYIQSKYAHYMKGRVIETEAEGTPYFIEEFLVNGGEIKAYTVTNKRLGQLAYFVEQNGNEIYAFDFITGESFQGKIFNAGARAVQGQSISTDLLSLENEGQGGTAAKKKRKFFGKSCGFEYDEFAGVYCECCYFVFWIATNCDPAPDSECK